MGNCCSSSSPHAHDYYNDNKPAKKKKNSNNKFKNFRCFSSSSRRNYITDIGVDERCRWSVSSSQPLPPHLFSILHNSVKSSDYLFTKYQVGEELGRGEFGVTRRCTNVKTGETLACKTISKRRLRSSVDIEDVRQEVEIMRQMPGNPNVVQLRDVFEDEESVHIVMEICEGGELFDRIVAKGHYTERAAAQVLRTIIEIVQHCHKNGVIHRDLKPENFLFANASENSPLKVIDFGLSVFFKPGERFKEIVGSPYYMAPEVLKRNYGPQVDVWSAGVILYIMLCGVPPFWAETDEGIAKAIIKSNVDFTREPWPKISENAKDLVRSMLDPNQYTRLTAEQVIEHPWLQNESAIPNIPLGDAVRSRIKQFSLMNKFKKKALSVVTEHLPIEEVAHIKDLFHKMDTKKNGSLTLNELKVGLELIGHQASDLDVGMLMEAADIDGNGTVDCDEFVTITVHLKRIHSEEHLPKAFNYFDKNQSGYIELEELEEALGEEANSQLIHDIFADVDKNKDGRISYEEFKAMMKAGTDWRNASHQYSRAKFNALSLKLFKDGSIKI